MGDGLTFGQWLQRELDAHGATTKSAGARLLGMSHTSMRRWIDEGVIPKETDTLQDIATKLRVPLWRVMVAAGILPPLGEWERDDVSGVSTTVLFDELRKRTNG